MNVPFLSHLLELRLRGIYIIISFCITFLFCTFYSTPLTHLICIPFSPGRSVPSLFIFTHVTEGLYAAIEVDLICALFFCFPLVIYQMYSFFIPSCYQGERDFIHTMLLSIILLLLTSICVAYALILPEICAFLRQFQHSSKCIEIKLEARIAPAVRWSSTAFLFTALFFQMPLIFISLCKGGLPPFFLRKNRKYSFFLILLATSLLSPPDVSTQCLLATIGCVLYESLFWCTLYYRHWLLQKEIQ